MQHNETKENPKQKQKFIERMGRRGNLDKTTLLVKLIFDLAALANFYHTVEDGRRVRANLQIVPRMGGHTTVFLTEDNRV